MGAGGAAKVQPSVGDSTTTWIITVYFWADLADDSRNWSTEPSPCGSHSRRTLPAPGFPGTSTAKKYEEMQLLAGKIHGLWCKYADNGRMFLAYSYKAGKLDGLTTAWYPDGTKRY